MKEKEAQKLLQFKREAEIVMAKGIRKMMGLSDEDKLDAEVFFGISAEVMRLAEVILK